MWIVFFKIVPDNTFSILQGFLTESRLKRTAINVVKTTAASHAMQFHVSVHLTNIPQTYWSCGNVMFIAAASAQSKTRFSIDL